MARADFSGRQTTQARVMPDPSPTSDTPFLGANPRQNTNWWLWLAGIASLLAVAWSATNDGLASGLVPWHQLGWANATELFNSYGGFRNPKDEEMEGDEDDEEDEDLDGDDAGTTMKTLSPTSTVNAPSKTVEMASEATMSASQTFVAPVGPSKTAQAAPPSPPVFPSPSCKPWQAVNQSDFSWSAPPQLNMLYKGKPINGSELAERLRNRRLLFMGDSVTRYLYVSLVYFLVSGQWKHPSIQLHNEKAFSTWKLYYEQSTAVMNTDHSHMICDCFRPDTLGAGFITKACENRYFFDISRNLSVTYVQLWSKYLVRGNDLDFLNATCSVPPCKQSGCQPGDCASGKGKGGSQSGWDFSAAAPGEAIRKMVDLVSPDTTFVNSGLWLPGYQDKPTTNSLVLAVEELSNRTRLIWRTTTASFNIRRKGVPVLQAPHVTTLPPVLQAAGWEILDMRRVTSELITDVTANKRNKTSVSWDGWAHFSAEVNRGLNELLLTYLAA